MLPLPLFAEKEVAAKNKENLTKSFLSFETLTKNINIADKNKLTHNNNISITHKKGIKKTLAYIPVFLPLDYMHKVVENMKPTIIYEILFLIPSTNSKEQDSIMATIFTYVRSIGNFSKIKYKNIKKGFIYPLFLSSQQILSPSDTIPINTLPLVNASIIKNTSKIQKESIFILQDMPPFGKVTSEYTYAYNTSFASFTGSNITPIFYKKISAVKEKEMITSLWIFRTEKGILIYGLGLVKINGVAILFPNIIKNSFESRMVGLFKWVQNEYYGIEQLK